MEKPERSHCTHIGTATPRWAATWEPGGLGSGPGCGLSPQRGVWEAAHPGPLIVAVSLSPLPSSPLTAEEEE